MKIHSLFRLSFALIALLALPLALSGCAPADQTDQPVDSVTAPPEPQYEVTPLIADPQSEIWIPGYWGMKNGQFFWVSGKVVPRPDPTAVWSSAHWVHHTFGWSFEKGHWE